MLVDAYGSDDSENSGDEQKPQPLSNPQLTLTKAASFSLPNPSNPPSVSPSSTALTLPAPRAKKAPKRITIDLPALSKDETTNYDGNETRPAKKARTESRGAGSSTLFSMLPAPKLAAPVKAAPERNIGNGRGPRLIFSTPSIQRTQATPGNIPDDDPQVSLERAENVHPRSLPFMPTSVRGGKANISVEESSNKAAVVAKSQDPPSPTAVDIFSLNSSKSPFASLATPIGTKSLPGISSAPTIDEYTPPEPTPNDPYPGYYQLPAGTWAAYDPEYYQQFYGKWKADYDREVRTLEKKEKGFEGADADDTLEVNALREMEKAKQEIQEREEKKALTKGAGGETEAPRMNIKGSKVSKGARKRGQLASLLVEAYQNREILEEKIAEGRRNRKEAGNKYGF